MIKKLETVKEMSSTYNSTIFNNNNKNFTQRSSFKNAFDKPLDNKRLSRYAKLNESPIIKIEEQIDETKKNYFSTQSKFLSKKKDENFKKEKFKTEDKDKDTNTNTNPVSLNSSVGLFENLNNKMTNKNNINSNKVKFENTGANFYKTDNCLKKHISPKAKNTHTQSQEIKNRNNLDKFLLDPRKKINIMDQKELKGKIKKNQSNKNVGTTSKSIINLNNPNIKFPYKNNLNKYSAGMEMPSPVKFNDNKNINININNKITNIYEFKGDYIEGNNDRLKIKKNLTEEEISQKLNLYKSKLNSQLIKIINEEKNKEKERMSNYENSESGKDKKEIEDKISNERIKSSDKIIKMNE